MSSVNVEEIYEDVHGFLYKKTPYIKKIHPKQIKKCVNLWIKGVDKNEEVFTSKLKEIGEFFYNFEEKNFEKADILEQICDQSMINFSALYEPYIDVLPHMDEDTDISTKISEEFKGSNPKFTESLFLNSKYVYLVLLEYINYTYELFKAANYLLVNNKISEVLQEIDEGRVSLKLSSELFKKILSEAKDFRIKENSKLREHNENPAYKYLPFNDLELPVLLNVVKWIIDESQKVDISTRLLQQKMNSYYNEEKNKIKAMIIKKISSRYESEFLWHALNGKFNSPDKFPLALEVKTKIQIEDILKVNNSKDKLLQEKYYKWSSTLFLIKQQTLKTHFTLMRFVEALEICTLFASFNKFVNIIDSTSSTNSNFCGKIKRGMGVIQVNNKSILETAMFKVNKTHDIFSGKTV